MSLLGHSPAEIRALPLRARTEWLRRRFGLRPRKSLGQNFLINEGAARRLAEAAVEPGLPLLEIGGGLGALSVPLAESGLPLAVVEIDEKAAEALQWLLGDLPQVRVVRADILQVDLWDLAEGAAPLTPVPVGTESEAKPAQPLREAKAESREAAAETAPPSPLSLRERGAGREREPRETKAVGVDFAPPSVGEGRAACRHHPWEQATIAPLRCAKSAPTGTARVTAIGNLPYSSAGAILQRLWAPDSPCGRIVVTVQREVAERLRAAPGSKAWGPLSVLAALHTEERRVLARLSAESFAPPPKVESVALVMERRLTPPAGLPDWEAVARALRGAFGTRRKTLNNSLRFALQLEPAQVSAILERAGLDGSRRGETLSVEEFLALARALCEI